MRILRLLCLFGALAIAAVGCAPLQQAPLVYSSKQTLGVDFSTATTEQPGMSLNLGFKSVDAAYVPVAVAKPCAGTSTAACTHNIYGLLPISGARTVLDSSTSKEALADARQVLTAFEAATGRKKAADDAVREAETVRTGLLTRQSQLETVLKMAQEQASAVGARLNAATSASDSASITAVTSELNKAKESVSLATKSLEEVKKAVTQADSDLETKRSLVRTAETEVAQQPVGKVADALKVVGIGDSRKADAYSVFGSFSANTAFGANTPSGATGSPTAAATASVTLGKIFSTGVASQNLTDGIAMYYANVAAAATQTSYASCLNAVTASNTALGLLTDGKETTGLTTDKKAQLQRSYEICQPSTARLK